ncbi:hypothetical protein MAL01_09355 [Leptospira noguchii]|uniref:hypothetical protein n=1 Tax=Leptospira noguchii TaxID=28182 RepID=UPI001FB5EDA8|nr:hypothetical protein [Leptospira noguchii]UOG32896.1 hypothetical protein MAL02_09180 [Leptospira noguchii]UOG43700.1 hypothetical protein MAL01_09355 [Leptospira noguchii]
MNQKVFKIDSPKEIGVYRKISSNETKRSRFLFYKIVKMILLKKFKKGFILRFI